MPLFVETTGLLFLGLSPIDSTIIYADDFHASLNTLDALVVRLRELVLPLVGSVGQRLYSLDGRNRQFERGIVVLKEHLPH